MRTKILRILRNADDYVSGQDLCEELGVSRTSIWKMIRQLKEDGYQIDSVQNRGYRIQREPEDLLNASEIESRLPDDRLGIHVYYKDETDSTNTWVRRLAEDGAASWTLTCADMQTAGKGRRGRSWASPSGTSLAMSLLLRPDIMPQQASMLTLVMGLAVAQAFDSLLGLPAQIKWPNDVVMDGRKLCGILTEMNAQTDYINYVVIGVGINVNMTEFPEELSQTATSARLETGHVVSRAAIAAEALSWFACNYEKFIAAGDLHFLKDGYDSLLVNRGREVRVLGPGEQFEGVAEGIDEKGDLLVRRADGTLEAVYAGEVSVRGVYGYV